MHPLHRTVVPSPVGPLLLLAEDAGLVALLFEHHRGAPAAALKALGRDGDAHPVLLHAGRELAEYFAGARRTFSIPLAPRGTDFQRRVWRGLEGIPFGETRTYAALAAALGAPGSARAVGAANGKNPLSIIVPCHRVIGAAGALTGYAGGLEAKRWLLDHEARRAASAAA